MKTTNKTYLFNEYQFAKSVYQGELEDGLIEETTSFDAWYEQWCFDLEEDGVIASFKNG